MNQKEIIKLLKKTPLFSRVSDKGLKAIAKLATEKTFKKGIPIVSEGAPGTGFYLILSGGADVIRKGEKIATLKSGAFFGEMALFDASPRSADVIATADTTCLVLTLWVIKSVIAVNPNVALAMLAELARRLRETDHPLS
jgi:CRP/FNR family transcriptional regulator, cyclic AMP receptor protein